MKQQIVQFGKWEQLVGVLTIPDRPESGALPVIIPNTGVDHRVGPNRLHVHLSRALAAAGFPTLRLDLSGMGDSTLPNGSVTDPTRDLQAAMHKMEQMHLGSRFALVGLCSGAIDAHLVTRVDPRIVAAAFIDGFVFPTPRYHLTYLAQRLFDPARIWRNVARRALSAEEHAKMQIVTGKIDYVPTPSRGDMQHDLLQFMRRRVSLCYFYTGQVQHVYNYRGQLTDAFPELRYYRNFRLHYMPLADHTFSRSSMRGQLAQLLVQWLREAGFNASGQSTTRV